MKRKTTRVCKVCTTEKKNEEFPKGKSTCTGCFHLLRCYICKGIFEKSKCRNKTRCNKCDNKLHYDLRINNPTPGFLAKIKRGMEKRKANYVKKPRPPKLNFEAIERMRISVHKIFKRWTLAKLKKSFDYLSFTKEQFLEKFPQIPPGMDIDHKVPLSWFKRDTPICIIYDLDNLQLLSRKENRDKCNYWAHSTSEEYYKRILPHIREEYINKLVINKL